MGERRIEPIEAHLDTIFTAARLTAMGLGANTFEADEVAQLTALKLWQRWEDAKVGTLREIGGTRWRGYIRQTARNTHVDLIRQHQRRLAREQRSEEGRIGRPIVDGVARIEPSPVGDVEAWAARDEIASEIARLSGQQRKVAAMLWVLEMSVAEVASELRIEKQTVRKHARAARETLRLRLAEIEALPG